MNKLDIRQLKGRVRKKAVTDSFKSIKTGDFMLIVDNQMPEDVYEILNNPEKTAYEVISSRKQKEHFHLKIKKIPGIYDQKIGEAAAKDYRKLMIFKTLGLDYYSDRNRKIAEELKEKGIAFDSFLNQLKQLSGPQNNIEEFSGWDRKRLVTFLLSNFHPLIDSEISRIKSDLTKVTVKHGDEYPFLLEVYEAFTDIEHYLTDHLRKEEHLIYPFILSDKEKGQDELNDIINHSAREHTETEMKISLIKSLTHNYKGPVCECECLQTVMEAMKKFEEKLHRQMHIENNILYSGLFPQEL